MLAEEKGQDPASLLWFFPGGGINYFVLNFNSKELDGKGPGYRKARRRMKRICPVGWEAKAECQQ